MAGGYVSGKVITCLAAGTGDIGVTLYKGGTQTTYTPALTRYVMGTVAWWLYNQNVTEGYSYYATAACSHLIGGSPCGECGYTVNAGPVLKGKTTSLADITLKPPCEQIKPEGQAAYVNLLVTTCKQAESVSITLFDKQGDEVEPEGVTVTKVVVEQAKWWLYSAKVSQGTYSALVKCSGGCRQTARTPPAKVRPHQSVTLRDVHFDESCTVRRPGTGVPRPTKFPKKITRTLKKPTKAPRKGVRGPAKT